MAAKTDLHQLKAIFATKAELADTVAKLIPAADFKAALVENQVRLNANNDQIAKVLDKLLVEIKGYRQDLAALKSHLDNYEDRLKRLERKLQKTY